MANSKNRAQRRREQRNPLTTEQLMPPQHPQAPPAHQESKRSNSRWAIAWNWFWKFLESTAILGVVGFYYQFSPNLSLTPQASFSGRDPFKIPFVISNNGYIDFHSVKTSCRLNEIEHHVGLAFKDTLLTRYQGETERLSAGEGLTVRCELQEVFNHSDTKGLISADISMIIDFKVFPYSLFRTVQREFRFVAMQSPDDRWNWLPQPSTRN